MFRFIVSLAWKNLMRYKRRTLITALAIAAGISMYILVDSMLKGAELESELNLQYYETGSGVITTEKYWEERVRVPTAEYMPDADKLLAELKQAGIAAAPRIVAQAELVVYEDPYPVDGSLRGLLTALDPAMDKEVFRLEGSIVKGKFLRAGNSEAVLGSWIANKLKADVGYPLTIVTRTTEGFMQTLDVTVVGIIDSPDPVINRTGVYLPIDYAREMLSMPGGANQLFVDTGLGRNKASEDKIAKVLSAREGLVYNSWEKLAEDFLAVAGAKQKGTGLILFLIFITAAVGISNTMLMAVYERIRELGMLRAIGMNDKDIRNLFLVEAACIGLIGAAFGAALGLVFDFFLIRYGIDFTSMLKDMDIGYRVAGSFRGIWNLKTVASSFFIGAIIAVIVSIFPVRRALKKSIVECLRK